MKTDWKNRWQARKNMGLFGAGTWVSLGLAFMLTVFAPLEIYLNNPDEFWYDAGMLLPWCLVYFAVAFGLSEAGFAVLFFLGDRWYDFGVAAYLTVFAGCYIQGNFLVKNLPALDGTELVLADYKSEITVSCVVWILVAAVVLGVCVKLGRERFRKVAGGVSLFVTLMLLLTIGTLFVTTAGYVRKDYLTSVKDNQFEMSRDANFVIFVLDAVDESKLEAVYARHPEYAEQLADFTWYTNVCGGYPCTDCAMPLMLSGEWYENEEPFQDYLHHVYGEGALFEELEQDGYAMSLYDADLQLSERVIGDRYQNMIHTKIYLYQPLLFAKRQMKMVGVKYAPWLLKQFCWFDAHQLWNQRVVDVDEDVFFWEDSLFYEDLQQQPVTYTDEKQFKMIHLEGAHAPFKYDADVNVVYDTDYASCIEASMTVFIEYLNKLKEAGVYDNTVIVMASDHGLNEDPRVMDGRQHPILFVKGANEHHALQTSDAPISHADYLGAYGKLLGGASSDAVFDWKEGDERERRYLFYYIVLRDHMVEYFQTGHASDRSTMHRTGNEFDYQKSN